MSCLECTDCLSIGPFDICCASISLAEPVTHNKYKVVITDVALGSHTTYENNNPNLIDLTPSEEIYAPGRTYEVRIYGQNACDLSDPQKMTNALHEGEHTCFSFEFERLT